MIVVALDDTSVMTDLGDPVAIRRGEAWHSDDPIVRRFPALFSADPANCRHTTPVEVATANPGERRNVVRGR